jgi:hypothetical protein
MRPKMSNVRARVVLVAVIATVVSTACSSDSLGGTVSIPTNPESQFTRAAGLNGHLRGGLLRGEQCLWVEATDGGPAALVAVVWPHGYSARFDPPRLVDSQGDVVATEGQQVSLGGGWNDGLPERCAISTRAFGAGRVELAT